MNETFVAPDQMDVINMNSDLDEMEMRSKELPTNIGPVGFFLAIVGTCLPFLALMLAICYTKLSAKKQRKVSLGDIELKVIESAPLSLTNDNFDSGIIVSTVAEIHAPPCNTGMHHK